MHWTTTMADISVLTVSLHNQEIGTLTQVGGDRSLFAFNEGYANDSERTTLGLSFKDPYGELITDFRPTRTRVSPFFSNLLPEGHLREYLANKAGVNARREFPLLWALGQDLPGALRIAPADGEPWPRDEKRSHDAGPEPIMRFSLAGVQLKFSAVMEASGGLTIPAAGIGGHWIIKLPSMTYYGVPENEFSMMTLARHVGIDVPEIQLLSVEQIAGLPQGIGQVKGRAFAIKRFDRSDNGPVHCEDFAQVFGVYPDDKYDKANYRNIARVIWIEAGEKGITEYVRRLIFNTLIGNADMHLKNWSMYYPDRHNAALAPAYDYVSTIAFLPDITMALNFGHSKRWMDVTIAELKYFAARAGLPERLVLDSARNVIHRFHEVWTQEKEHLPLTRHVRDVIEQHLKTIPLIDQIGGT
jgi:serine/threonine-protein kinase HipA